jgi:hypothetical protein
MERNLLQATLNKEKDLNKASAPNPTGRLIKLKPAPAPQRKEQEAARGMTLRHAIETATETLWAVLLFLVLAFLVAKAPMISETFNEMTASLQGSRTHVSNTTAESDRIQELEVRLARTENRVVALERGIAELREKNAKLTAANEALTRDSTGK